MESGQGQRNIKSREGFSDATAKVSRLLFSVSFSILHNQELCADAVQNAIMKAWRNRRSLREASKFKSWIVKIVINESKHIAKQLKELPLEEDIPAAQFGHEVRIDVANAVQKLDEKYRIPIVLFYFEDMSVSEIATVLALPKGTVVSRLSRARDRLKKELKDYGI
ncbi:MAG: RNA polymerase sigma factor [Clostridia bacterium]|nr:RNA polymerase sigma factor [Clostridia bacterium]